jgi:exodeoxyribonuclease VII large subunit
MQESRLPVAIERRLTSQRHLLESLTLKLQGFDPQLLLSRGYSITLHNGRAVRDPKQLKPGDEIETRVEHGTIRSVVKS